MAPVDLRSDTVTVPTDAMRRAMAEAEVGDDVYGEDPTVRGLQEHVAGMFGRDAALFVTSGVQANLLGMHVLARPGTEVLVEQDAHLVAFEVGSSAMFAGVQWRTVSGDRGRLRPDVVAASLRPGTFPFTEVSAVALEETTNLAGGSFLGAAGVAAVRDIAAARGLSTWLDGARLFNAIVAGGGSPADYGAAVDALTFCASKGLGAPVGSVIVGDADVIEEATAWRRRHGGAMRQVGVLAAAARHAIDHHVDRLAEDHANARFLAEALADAHPGSVDPDLVDTNILYVTTAPDAASEVVARCREDGVLVSGFGSDRLRLVTHLGIERPHVETAAGSISSALAATA